MDTVIPSTPEREKLQQIPTLQATLAKVEKVAD